MKRWIALALLLAVLPAWARPFVGPPEPLMPRPSSELAQRVVKVVDHYIAAIACQKGGAERRFVAVLEPEQATRWGGDPGTYVALWDGDVGCTGGSGEEHVRIAVVGSDGHGRLYVDTRASSPDNELDFRVRDVDRIVRNTRDTLVLEGWRHGPMMPSAVRMSTCVSRCTSTALTAGRCGG